MVDLEALLQIVSGLQNEKCVTSSQTTTQENKGRTRAEALRNISLANLIAAN